jgi:hypothetical protein
MKQGAEVIIVPTYWLATDITERGLKYDPEYAAALPGAKQLQCFYSGSGEASFLDSMVVTRAYENECVVVFVKCVSNLESALYSLQGQRGWSKGERRRFTLSVQHTADNQLVLGTVGGGDAFQGLSYKDDPLKSRDESRRRGPLHSPSEFDVAWHGRVTHSLWWIGSKSGLQDPRGHWQTAQCETRRSTLRASACRVKRRALKSSSFAEALPSERHVTY